jgi:hypothetical protein
LLLVIFSQTEHQLRLEWTAVEAVTALKQLLEWLPSPVQLGNDSSQDGPHWSSNFSLAAKVDARQEDQKPMNDAGRSAVLQRSQLLKETVHHLLGDDGHFLFRQAYSQLVR